MGICQSVISFYVTFATVFLDFYSHKMYNMVVRANRVKNNYDRSFSLNPEQKSEKYKKINIKAHKCRKEYKNEEKSKGKNNSTYSP